MEAKTGHADPGLFLRRIMESPCKFITAKDVEVLSQWDTSRLLPVLIRFQGCRLVAPMQDCAHIIQALEAQRDYCRDASVPVSDIDAWKKAEAMPWES